MKKDNKKLRVSFCSELTLPPHQQETAWLQIVTKALETESRLQIKCVPTFNKYVSTAMLNFAKGFPW